MNIKIPILLIALFHFFIFSFSQTYYSINDGLWSSTANVWSLDGVNPCSCAPSFNISGFDVIVRHRITMDNNVTINNGDSLIIDAKGVLESFSNRIDIIDGYLYNGDTLRVTKVDVQVDGELVSDGYLEFLSGNIYNYGIFTLNSNAHLVILGNFYNYAGANWNLNYSITRFNSGNVINYGDINLDHSCIILDMGNVQNHPGGAVNGNGGFDVNGNIQNNGFWSAMVAWCAQGNSFNMPIPEDCSNTNPCIGSLPIEFTQLSGCSTTEGNQLKWEINTDVPVAKFTVERMNAQHQFSPVGELNAGNASADGEYAYTDPVSSTAFYRIRGTDINGESYLSPVVEITSAENRLSAELYPNPCSGQAHIQLNLPAQDEVKISVCDITGRTISDHDFGSLGAGNHQLQVDLQGQKNGIFFIRVQTLSGKSLTLKAISQ